MKNITLQRVKINNHDIELLLSLEKSIGNLKTYSAMTDKKETEDELKESIVYFIKENDEVVGNIEYQKKADGSIYLSGLMVKPEFQGKGIGREAMRQVLEEVSDVERIWLATHPSNTPAIKLYLSFGFIIEEKIENYFGDGEPRIIMSRKKKDK